MEFVTKCKLYELYVQKWMKVYGGKTEFHDYKLWELKEIGAMKTQEMCNMIRHSLKDVANSMGRKQININVTRAQLCAKV